jgi:hypothetical protein
MSVPLLHRLWADGEIARASCRQGKRLFFVDPIEFNEKRVQLERNGPITAGKQDGQLVRNLANEIKINRNVIVGFPNHEARVLRPH